MIPAHSYESICESLIDYFTEKRKRNRNPSASDFPFPNMSTFGRYSDILETESRLRSDKVKLVGILFVQPPHKIAKDEILPNLSYYHYRSGKNVNFYLAGYGAFWNERDYPDIEVACRVEGTEWLFSSVAFNNLRKELELKSKWHYSGECDLVITNARVESSSRKVFLDFSSCIAVNLDELTRIGSIPSVMKFFELIFRYAENQDLTDPTWGLSDSLGIVGSKSALRTVVLSLLPRDIGKEADKLSRFAVTDVSK